MIPGSLESPTFVLFTLGAHPKDLWWHSRSEDYSGRQRKVLSSSFRKAQRGVAGLVVTLFFASL